MKIVSDSSAMYSIEQGAQRGIVVLPLTVAIGGETWLEFEEIQSEEFLQRIEEGGMPQSSCPPPHNVLEAFNTEEEVVYLTLADGLSGSYEVTCSLASQAPHPENIHVVNTKTLCVPHRALDLVAQKLSKECANASEMVERLKPLIESVKSYLLPMDFEYLKRGGRLAPLAATFAHITKVQPVLAQSEDGTHLEKLHIARNFKKGVDSVIKDLKSQCLGAGHFVGISHAGNIKDATKALEKLKEAFPACTFGVFELSPAFITQGGPGCVAIQSIDLSEWPGLDLS